MKIKFAIKSISKYVKIVCQYLSLLEFQITAFRTFCKTAPKVPTEHIDECVLEPWLVLVQGDAGVLRLDGARPRLLGAGGEQLREHCLPLLPGFGLHRSQGFVLNGGFGLLLQELGLERKHLRFVILQG